MHAKEQQREQKTKQFSNTLGDAIGSTLEERIISAGLYFSMFPTLSIFPIFPIFLKV